jgi:hypothetical protein
MKYTWWNDAGYIRSTINNKMIYLSRYVMNYSGDLFVDHINNNSLDNRRINLRIVTPSQNGMNKSVNKNGSSKYLGVGWHKKDKKWSSQIRVNGKVISLGHFLNEIDAAKARDRATKKYFGEFGKLNFA